MSSDVRDVDVVSCSRNPEGIFSIDSGCISGDIGVGDTTRRRGLHMIERRLNELLCPFGMADSPS